MINARIAAPLPADSTPLRDGANPRPERTSARSVPQPIAAGSAASHQRSLEASARGTAPARRRDEQRLRRDPSVLGVVARHAAAEHAALAERPRKQPRRAAWAHALAREAERIADGRSEQQTGDAIAHTCTAPTILADAPSR